MSDELREAAERLASIVPRYSELWKATGAKWTQEDKDLWLCAGAYLAEHPTDDGSELTEGYLKSLGFERDGFSMRLRFSKAYGDDICTFELVVSDVPNLLDSTWEMWATSCELSREGSLLPCEPKSRGELRLLLKSLGVEVKS